jgi:hypothetical protein
MERLQRYSSPEAAFDALLSVQSRIGAGRAALGAAEGRDAGAGEGLALGERRA